LQESHICANHLTCLIGPCLHLTACAAGVSVMPPELEGRPLVIKSTGKISALRNRAYQQLEAAGCDPASTAAVHVGIGHTRWATVSCSKKQSGQGCSRYTAGDTQHTQVPNVGCG
jgi:hypothetical protein